MQSTPQLNAIPDDELLHRLAALLQTSRHTEADLVAHIGEVDARRLYAREASPSMWAYCTERLHLSGAEAYLRIAAARVSRDHPVVLEMLADGRLHLTAVALLAPHLTCENRESLLRRATHKSKREIEELVAEIQPRPDVPTRIRKLPDRQPPMKWSSAAAASALVGGTESHATSDAPLPGTPLPIASSSAEPAVGADGSSVVLRPDEVVSSGLDGAAPTPRSVAKGTPREPAIEPLSPARYKVQFTASADLREKLERLRALMRSSVPDGDLAAIIEAAVTEKLARLEGGRFGRTKAPRKSLEASDVSPRSRHVPAAVRRAVHDRDEGRCQYVNEQGRRCTARTAVELHHRQPFALGGDHSLQNVSLLCRAHNRHLAEIDYGRVAMARHARGPVATKAP
jgi:hypothetical protein